MNAVIEALNGLLNHYCELVDSGDAGHWDPEEDKPVIKAREALSSGGWIEHDGSKPIEGGRYWVMSSYGVRLAGHHDWGDCFQDEITGCDEGMHNMRGKEFEVSHYIPIIEPEPPEECAE